MKDVLIGALCGLLLLVAYAVVTEQLTNGKPTVCDYEVAFIYRTQFRPGDEGDKDFAHSITSQVEWLHSHNCEVLSMNLEYGFDMTQNLILRFAVIKYKEIKNG